MQDITKQLNKELAKIASDPKNIKDYSRFHKEKIKAIGIASPILRKVSSKYFQQIKSLEKKEIFYLCEELLKSKHMGRRSIAFDWAFRIRKRYTKQDFVIFESWLKKYVNSWGSCDDFCTHAFGHFLYEFPEFITKTRNWAKSKNMWFRRASVVSLIYSIRRKQGLDNIFTIANLLLRDEEDLVQKGYGWTLKEASNKYLKEVFDFVMKRKNKMPRTALRYAIEKMPANWKKEAMKVK